MKKTAVTLVCPSLMLLISDQLKPFLASLLLFSHLHPTYPLKSNIVMLHLLSLTISNEKSEPRLLSPREIFHGTTSGGETKSTSIE